MCFMCQATMTCGPEGKKGASTRVWVRPAMPFAYNMKQQLVYACCACACLNTFACNFVPTLLFTWDVQERAIHQCLSWFHAQKSTSKTRHALTRVPVAHSCCLVSKLDRVHAEKLELLRQICTEVGVHTIPQCIEGLWIVPLYSWYHASFDTEPDIPGAIPVQKVGPWPISIHAPSHWLQSRNVRCI